MNSLQVEERSTVGSSSASKGPFLLYVLLAVVTIYIIMSFYLIFNTLGRLESTEAGQWASIEALKQRQSKTERELTASNDALAQRLGVTEQDLQWSLQVRADELQRQQRGLAKRLQNQAEKQQEQIGQVSGEVSNVRTELGGAKTEIAATRNALASTNAKLDSAIGDLTGQSHLIARTREELEQLRHRGDRSYFEFTLYKGSSPTPVSTVSLQLKKVNAKKNRFTLNVLADDRIVEKKDRGIAEPLQFYTGRDHILYEVVIWTTENNRVTGYLSTPKSITIAASN